MVPRLPLLFLALFLPVAAFAHGEDVLVPIYGQAAVVVAILISLWLFPSIRPFWLFGGLGCFAGVALAWLALTTLPFSENQGFIIFAMAAAPAMLSAVLVLLAKRRASK
jgi:hypothetical protein